MQDGEPLGSAEEYEVVRFRDGRAEESTSPVATEVAFTIEANGKEIATLLCTPADLEEFCLGFLFTSGVIQGREDVRSCRCDTERWVGHVEVSRLPDLELLGKRILTPGCGKGIVFASAVEMASRLPLRSDLRVGASAVLEGMHALEAGSDLHRRTGGVHSAALAEPTGGLIRIIDDIGRHNAVDKVIGDALRRDIGLRGTILVCSGRVSSEILHKTKRGDIPVVVSRCAPTHQSVLRARAMGITLVGFARGRNFTVYSHPERVIPGIPRTP